MINIWGKDVNLNVIMLKLNTVWLFQFMTFPFPESSFRCCRLWRITLALKTFGPQDDTEKNKEDKENLWQAEANQNDVFITVRIRFNFFTIPENKKYTHSCAALAGTLFFIDRIQCLQWSHSESHCSPCATLTLPTPRMSHVFSEPGMLAPSGALTELIAETEIQNLAGYD